MKNTEINFEKLHWDIRKKIKNDGLTLEKAAEKINLSPMVFRSIYKGVDIRSSTLVRILNWLDKDLKEYLA